MVTVQQKSKNFTLSKPKEIWLTNFFIRLDILRDRIVNNFFQFILFIDSAVIFSYLGCIE